MAKLSAHGSVVGTVEYIHKARRYMSDGVILRNDGFGWKLGGKLKPGVMPADAYARAKQRQVELLATAPCTAAYKRALHDMAGMNLRWKLHAAVSLMPDDPDGVWSECCDGYGDNIHADVDEVVELCRLFQSAVREARESRGQVGEG